jgi:hypothetical protein
MEYNWAKTMMNNEKKTNDAVSTKNELPTMQEYLNYIRCENATTEDNGVGYSHYIYVK